MADDDTAPIASGTAAADDVRQDLGLEAPPDEAAPVDPFAHAAVDTTHSHEHAAMGASGDDDTHTHEHTHNNDANHDHHGAGDTALQTGLLTFTDGNGNVSTIGQSSTTITFGQMSDFTLNQPKTAEQRLAAWGTERPGFTKFHVELPNVEQDVYLPLSWDDTRHEPIALTAALDASENLVDNPGGNWHAYLCVEGVQSDEDIPRELAVGSCQSPDLPVSLRLLHKDEYGHYGAVTCGRIDTMERQLVNGMNVMYATGIFTDDHSGQLAQMHVEQQSQRFVSIDPRDYDAELVEVQVERPTLGAWTTAPSTTLLAATSSLVIGAATIVPMPAFQQAVITMSAVELPEAPLATARAQDDATVLLASGNSEIPPAAWFKDPELHVGDPRLVRQPDGKYACPLTMQGDRVFGHIAYWGQKHTGSRTLTPHSPTYAYFHTGSVDTELGLVPVGQITMGCGHAPLSSNYAAAIGHYDGGYGAVQAADVRCGEDDLGIWCAGRLRPELTDQQRRDFAALAPSGDWREVVRGSGQLCLSAVLQVPVPGFPIAREALIACGAEEILEKYAARAGMDDKGRVTALVAAGRVHRIPTDDRLAMLEDQVQMLLRKELKRDQQAAAERMLGLA